MRILWNFACRSRKDKMFVAINNIIEMATTDDYLILMSLDADDPALANREVWDRLQAYGDKVKVVYGFSKGKIDAINRSVWAAGEWDILVCWSDDMVINKKGFDQRIIDVFNNSEESLMTAPHFPDGHVNERLLTLSILGRKLYDTLGYVYHPDFISVFSDNLFMDMVKANEVYQYIPEFWYEHAHAMWLKHEPDEQLKFTESFYAQDKLTYQRLRKENPTLKFPE